MQWIEDATGEKVKIGQPLYDGTSGILCSLDYDAESSEVVLEDPFDSSEIHRYDYDFFVEEGMLNDFFPINKRAVDEPVMLVEELLTNLSAGVRNPMDGYNSWDLQYAMNAVVISEK